MMGFFRFLFALPFLLWFFRKGVLAFAVIPFMLMRQLSDTSAPYATAWPAPTLFTVVSCSACVVGMLAASAWLVVALRESRSDNAWWLLPALWLGAAALGVAFAMLVPAPFGGRGALAYGFIGMLYLGVAVGVPVVFSISHVIEMVKAGVETHNVPTNFPAYQPRQQISDDPTHWQFDARAKQEQPRPEASAGAETTMTRAERDARSEALDAPIPPSNLGRIAGMAALKADLAPVLIPFRSWSTSSAGQESSAAAPDRNGILLSGPPGNGKSTIAEAIAGDLQLPFLKPNISDMTNVYLNESSQKISALFSQAIAGAPCVLFIDEIDAIAPRRDDRSSHQEDKKVVNTLLQQIDRLRKHRVLLIAATNYVDNIDSAVIRDGRFDYRIEIPWPDEPARLGMLKAMAAKHALSVPEAVAAAFAHRWERRSAAFIENVVKRARDLPGALTNPLTSAQLLQCDRAVSKRAGNLPGAGLKLSEIYLLPEVRREATSIVNRLAHWDEIAAQGGSPPRGILLYGPPGTGKTMLASAMARELGDWHLFEVRTSEILADPREFKKVMDLAAAHRPAFVFIDEADDLLRDRSTSFSASATNEILKAMDGMMGAVPEVVFIAATNNPDAIDAAAKRSGRFSEKLFMDDHPALSSPLGVARSELGPAGRSSLEMTLMPGAVSSSNCHDVGRHRECSARTQSARSRQSARNYCFTHPINPKSNHQPRNPIMNSISPSNRQNGNTSPIKPAHQVQQSHQDRTASGGRQGRKPGRIGSAELGQMGSAVTMRWPTTCRGICRGGARDRRRGGAKSAARPPA